MPVCSSPITYEKCETPSDLTVSKSMAMYPFFSPLLKAVLPQVAILREIYVQK
jgi:hypothetical protein